MNLVGEFRLADAYGATCRPAGGRESLGQPDHWVTQLWREPQARGTDGESLF